MAGPPPASGPARGFALRAAAWIVGLVALLRLPWVQTHLLVPFAGWQQRAAEGLSGVSGAVVVDASCTGSDAMALTLGAILAFPTSWRSRLIGCLAGLGLLTAANTARIGTLSVVAHNRPLFDLLHVYLWPAALMLVAAGFVFAWMQRQSGPQAPSDGRPPALPTSYVGRALLFSLAAVAAYYVATPLLSKSAWLMQVAGWCAATAGGIAAALGLEVQVQDNYFFTSSGRWIVTQACILTPLIALYLAGVAAAPIPRHRRLIAALATAPLFFLLGVARLLVLTLPTTLVPAHGMAMHAFYQVVAGASLILLALWTRNRTAGGGLLARGAQALGVALAAALTGAAIGAFARGLAATASGLIPALAHLGHGYVDAQGALLVLPAFLTGTWAGLWWALDRPAGWSGLGLGWLLLAAFQGLTAVTLGELHAHFGAEVPVVLIRALALTAPAALALAVRPRSGVSIGIAPGASAAVS